MNLLDSTEFEAKFYPVDKKEYRNKLQSIGAKLVVPERKMVRVIADPDANNILPKDSYIRIRDEGNLIRLSYKKAPGKEGKIGDQKEIEVEVNDFEKTAKILELSGINFNRRQETLREEWKYEGTQITIDSWPGLSPYSEIEANSEEKVKEVAERLGFDWDKKIVSGIREVFERVYGLSGNVVLKMITSITFENNPFKDLSRVWNPKNQWE